jgi:tetratricopeptide (TPR) repeat protein
MGAAEQAPDGYILKPLTESLLLARLNRAWDRKQAFTAIERAYAERDYLQAAALCDQRMASAPLHAMDLLRMKAGLLLKAGQPQAARKVYEAALTLREQVWAKAGLARIDSLEGRHADAKNRLLEIVREHPSFLDAYDQLAQAMQQLGEHEQALEVLEQAAHLSPYSVMRQKNLGDVALQLGKLDVAEQAYQTSIAVGEYSILKSPEPYLGLARLYGMNGRPQDAVELLAAARQNFPEEQIDLQVSGIKNQISGASPSQKDKARPDAKGAAASSSPAPTKAGDTVPAPALALYQRAQVLIQYMKTNGYNFVSAEEVRAVLKRSEKLAPGNARAQELLEALQDLAAGRN